MPSTFHVAKNNVATTVAAGRSAGSPSIVVATGTGASFGSTFPLIATASRAGAVLAIFEVTGRSTDTLTVSGAIEGTTDVALLVGDALEMRPTALAISEVQAALNTLETTTVILPYATDDQAAFPGIAVACRGDSLTAGAGATPYPTQLAALVPRAFLNDGVSGYTSTQIKDLMVADPNVATASSIIWSGRNNFAAPTTVAADDASMVAAMGHDRYLILGVLNAAGEGTGTTAYTQIQAVNATKAATYPGHYVPIREHLVSLYDPGIPQDVTDQGNDVVPTSLRQDTLHLNTAGYGAVAAFLATYQGVLDGPDVPLKPSSLAGVMLAKADDAAVVHATGAETIAGVKTFAASPIVKQDGFTPAWLQADGLHGLRFFGTGDGTVYIQATDDGFAADARTVIQVGSYAGGSPLTLAGSVSFTGVVVSAGPIGASFFTTPLTAGNDGSYNVTRRDTGATAFEFYSAAGDLAVFDNVLSGNVLTIAATTHAATFLGGVTAASFAGDGSALTGLTKAQVGLGSVENTALSTWAGSANLTTLGTVTAGSLDAARITSGTLTTARIGSGTPAGGMYVDGGTGAWTALPAADANALATYIVQTATNAPANAQVLASLATGILKVTTTTGVVSIAAAGTDYLTPTGSGASLTGLTKAQVGLANVENTALSTWAGSANLTTLGTVTAGSLDAARITSGTLTTARIGTGTAAAGKYVDGAAGAWTALPASTGANALGTYIVQTATNAPANAQVLASLATGMLKVTTTTGVVSIGVAGTDYVTPTGSGAGLTALNASNLTTGTVATARLATGTASASTFHRGDGTWAAASGTGDMFANMVNTVVSVTTTTTLTATAFAKLHACSGTTANYTVTLPAVSGNTGKFIGFRMVPGLTKLVTLDGNAAETIDGATTRVLWANEAAILYCDGVTWTKIAGKTIPMVCGLRAVDGGTAQTVPSATGVTINLNTANDPSGMMADTTNHRVVIARAGSYVLGAVVESNGINVTAANRWLTIVAVNGSADYVAECAGPVNGSPSPFVVSDARALVPGDLISLQTYQDSGNSQALAGNALGAGTASYLSVTEILLW